MITEGSKNSFLAQVMKRARAGRPLLREDQPFFNRIERVPAGNYVEVWFQTRGCQWDAQGGCTMCNYGHGRVRSSDEIVSAVQSALTAIGVHADELLVSPSGSMFDPWEVPDTARHKIYELLHNFPTGKLLIETRTETINTDTLDELVSSQPPGRQIAVETGLESACAWVQRFCINKGSEPQQFSAAARQAHDRGLEIYANVCLGTAFLSASETIEDVVKTVKWALAHEGSRVVIFPLHVKPYTLLSVLEEYGWYRPVSLWSLAEVLRRLPRSSLERTEIAWYKSYYDDDAKVRFSPTTCDACRNKVLSLLDDYRATQHFDPIDQLLNIECGCRDEWMSSLERHRHVPLPDRVEAAYVDLAKYFGLTDWIARHGQEIFSALRESSPHVGCET